MRKAPRTGSRYAALTGQGLDIKSVFPTSETSPILFSSSPAEAMLESEELWGLTTPSGHLICVKETTKLCVNHQQWWWVFVLHAVKPRDARFTSRKQKWLQSLSSRASRGLKTCLTVFSISNLVVTVRLLLNVACISTILIMVLALLNFILLLYCNTYILALVVH